MKFSPDVGTSPRTTPLHFDFVLIITFICVHVNLGFVHILKGPPCETWLAGTQDLLWDFKIRPGGGQKSVVAFVDSLIYTTQES